MFGPFGAYEVIAGILTFLIVLFFYRVYFKVVVPERKLSKEKVVGQFTSEVFWGTVAMLIGSIVFSPGVIMAGIGWLFAILVNIKKIKEMN